MTNTKLNRLITGFSQFWRDLARTLGLRPADDAQDGAFHIKPGPYKPARLTMIYPTRWRVAPAPRALTARDLSELHALHGRRLLSDGKRGPHATVPRDSHLRR